MIDKAKGSRKFPTSIKLDDNIKEQFQDWCWLNRESVSSKVEELIKDFLKNNPVSKGERVLIDKHKKTS